MATCEQNKDANNKVFILCNLFVCSQKCTLCLIKCLIPQFLYCLLHLTCVLSTLPQILGVGSENK